MYGKLPDGTYARCHECNEQCEEIREGREEACCDCYQKHDSQQLLCNTCEARVKERKKKKERFDKRKMKLTELLE